MVPFGLTAPAEKPDIRDTRLRYSLDLMSRWRR